MQRNVLTFDNNYAIHYMVDYSFLQVIMSPSAAIRVPDIDYRAHPAFRDFPHAQPADDAAFEASIAQIDHLFAERERSAKAKNLDALPPFASAVLPAQTELLARIANMRSLAADTQTWLQKSLVESLRIMGEELQIIARQQRSIDRHQLEQSTVAARYLASGITSIPLPAGTSARWLKSSSALQDKLRAQSRTYPTLRQHAAIAEYSRLGLSIVHQLKSIGAWRLAEQLQGCALELAFLDLHYSYPQQTWYQNCYQDIGLPTSEHSYLHYDYRADSQKMLVYFAPVAGSNGPFCFVPHSQSWQRSTFRHVMSKVLDKVHTQIFAPKSPDGYYRARFRGDTERARFASLPRALQVTSHFGDDVLPDTPMAQLVKQHEQNYLDIDTVVIFNGNRGIHRGGLCTQGERWAVHLGLEPVQPRSRWKKLRRQLSKVRAAWR
jgi:hypothetical protein